jgi:capsule polysaccharide modification protein KpsS
MIHKIKLGKVNRMFTYYSDHIHGWMKVEANDLYNANLKPSDFSFYSYKGLDCFYLEKDCDLPKFLKAFESFHGKAIINDVFTISGASFIRNLPAI